MSLARGISTAMRTAIAGDNLRDDERARTMQEKNIALAEEKAGYGRDQMDLNRAMSLAKQLGVSKNGGLELDIPKLTEILKTGRASNKFNSTAEELASLIANTDYTARKNEGFAFNGFTIGPENTLTMRGSYAGQDGEKVATTGGGAGADEEVAFATVDQVATLLSDQYNQMWSKRANAGAYNEITDKQRLAGTFDQVDTNRQTVRKAVGDLREQVDTFLASSNDPAYKAAARKLKGALGQPGLSDDDKLEILRDFGSKLDLPVGEILTPEVQAATAQASTPTSTAASTSTAAPTQDNSAEIARLEERLAKVPIGRPGAARKKALKKQIAELKAEGTTQADSAPEITNLAQRVEESVVSGAEQVVRATPQELAALKQSLEAKGVKSFEELNKATREEQIVILSVLSSASYVPEDQQLQYREELRNLTETGTLSYDSKSLDKARNDARGTQVSEANSLRSLEQLQQDVGEKTAGKVQEAQTSFRDALYGKGEGKDRQITNELQWNQKTVRTKIFGPSGAFSQLFEEYSAADDAVGDKASGVGNITGRKRDRIRKELNSMYSQVVQAMNESGDYEWSWLTRDTADGVITDDTFQRIRLTADETGFEVIDPASGQPTGDTIPASDISRIMGRRYFQDFKNELKTAKR